MEGAELADDRRASLGRNDAQLECRCLAADERLGELRPLRDQGSRRDLSSGERSAYSVTSGLNSGGTPAAQRAWPDRRLPRSYFATSVWIAFSSGLTSDAPARHKSRDGCQHRDAVGDSSFSPDLRDVPAGLVVGEDGA